MVLNGERREEYIGTNTHLQPMANVRTQIKPQIII